MTVPKRPLYDGLLADLYDSYLIEDDLTDVANWQQLLADEGGPTLELGSGTGRVLLPLLASGLDVEGLDNSPDMLDRCRIAARAAEQSPTLHLADMTEFDLGRRYQSVICPLGTMMLLSGPGEFDAALTCIARHLEPGGLFAFTMELRPSGPRVPFVRRDTVRNSDRALLLCFYEPLQNEDMSVDVWRMTIRVHYPDGTEQEETAIVRYLYLDECEIRKRLKSVGFRDIDFVEAEGKGPDWQRSGTTAMSRWKN